MVVPREGRTEPAHLTCESSSTSFMRLRGPAPPSRLARPTRPAHRPGGPTRHARAARAANARAAT
eukprot:12894091-Alexandrium_andersonii.AAC.1